MHRPSLTRSKVSLNHLQVLANLLILYAMFLVLGLQNLLYDTPTPTQIDEVFDKFTLAIIETILATLMTRQDINGCFLLMFTVFLAGKWWALFGESRTKRQEAYPSRVSFLMYVRFGTATLLSIAFDVCMVTYTIRNAGQPTLRPAMTALFSYEFAILAISSLSTAARLALWAIATVDVRHRTILSQQQRGTELALFADGRRAMPTRASSWDQDGPSSDLSAAAGEHAREETVRFWRDRRWSTHLEVATGEWSAPWCSPAGFPQPSNQFSRTPRPTETPHLLFLPRHPPAVPRDPRTIHSRAFPDPQRADRASAGSPSAREDDAAYY